MFKSLSKRVLSIVVCLALLLTNLVYADTVVVGVAPGTGTKNMSSSAASTTYLQNQFTGPGLLPNSSTTNYSPIQGVSYDYSVGQNLSNVDQNGAENKGPTVKTITSPAAHNIELSTVTGSTNVITNGLVLNYTDDRSADKGPTFHEIASPTSNNEMLSSENANSGPGAVNNNPQQPAAIPSYTTQRNQTTNATQAAQVDMFSAANNGVIIYTVNNGIQAVKPNITAPGALVVNATTRQIYFSKGGLNAFHPAALTTLVTASLLLSFKRLDDVLAVSPTAVTGLESGASTAGLKAGDVITVRDALGAMFVRSCCDVANVVAENVSGSIPNFVALMNQTVKNWGCVATNFTNPTGLNNDAQVTNTYDAAIIIDKVSSDPTLKLMLQQQAYTLPATAHRAAKALTTTNQLLINGNKNYYAGITSKMGYTSKAKYTVASEIDYNGQRLIAVVLKANGSQFTDTTKLLNFAKIASLEAATSGLAQNTVLNVANNVSTQAMAANMAANAAISSVPIAATTVAVGSGTNSLLASTADTAGTWQKDAKGWFFLKANGQSAANEWIKQNGKIYCVDSTGYMITGWRQMSNGAMYYFDPNSGELRHNTWINVSTGAYYLQADGTLAKADKGTTKNIVTSVGTYTIDENGKALAKVA
ncbi:MAG: hypothetical protein IKP66_09490 [Lachnospiraceae bacterium]|nr:hypothetical protein [Lachnospiraceae bacterium]